MSGGWDESGWRYRVGVVKRERVAVLECLCVPRGGWGWGGCVGVSVGRGRFGTSTVYRLVMRDHI